MGHLIDRRLNGKNKSAVNRQRFLRRHRGEIRKVVEGNLRRRSIADTESGEKIRIPSRGMHEPVFQHGEGGEFTHVLPGNKEFVVGDRFPRPQSGSGGGRQGSPDGEGLDDFVFEINRQEFLDLLFEDMALPNLTKRQLSGQEAFQYRRAGFSTSGNPSNIDIRRSLKAAVSRRTAMTAGLKRQQRELQQQLDALDGAMAGEGDALTEQELRRVRESRAELQQRLEQVSGRIARMPFLDEFDIHYRRHEKVPVPRSRAVMLCLMDVRGSLDVRS